MARRPNGRLARLTRAQEAGKKARADGDPRAPPYTVQAHREAWTEGYDEARAELAALTQETDQ